MIKRRGSASFLRKAAHALLISSEIRRKKFERDLSAQPAVLSEINFAHSTRGERRQNLVRPDFLARQQFDKIVDKELGRYFVSGNVKKASILLVCKQERFHFASKVVVTSTSLAQKAGALPRRASERLIEYAVYLLPALRCHDMKVQFSSSW